ncbi:hypothetical protein F4821DRAFT_91813 [Hypoxylon rubiginosum]|uniref:Uncharacterized protein n=1 Tax=Hypoxylon rubiginosum TaxID=110542 RepID=A0ACC0D6P9_9PEZI|nr:hypothetical protein F4821DRAFT_91813 [Hypoxylon rubiginosum]
MAAGLEDFPPELVEIIVRHLDVKDVGNLRLTSRCLRSKASQVHFRSYFRSKRVKLTSPHLEEFEAVTRRGSLGCEIRDLTLVGVVRSLEAAVERADSEGKHPMQRWQERQKERQQNYELIVRRLSDVFKNIAANSVAGRLHSLSLEVAEYPIGGEGWRFIWQSTADTSRIIFSALQESRIRLDHLNLFNGSHLYHCSIASNKLSSIDYSTDALSQSLGSVRSLSISVSDRILDVTETSSGWADESDWSGLDDEEEEREGEEESDSEAAMVESDLWLAMADARDENNFIGLAGLIHACQNLKILHIHQYEVNRRRIDSRVTIPSELIFQRGIATLNMLPPIEECSLSGVFLRESDMLAFLERSSKTLRALSMKTVTMVTGSFRPVFDYIASRIPNLDYLYLDELVVGGVGGEPVHFMGVGQPRFHTWVGAHGSWTLRRAGSEETQQPIPYHLPTGAPEPVGSPEMTEWLHNQRQEYGPPSFH